MNTTTAIKTDLQQELECLRIVYTWAELITTNQLLMENDTQRVIVSTSWVNFLEKAVIDYKHRYLQEPTCRE